MFQENHSRARNQRDCFIHVPLMEIVTPSICSKVVSEIIKYLVYQKQQIPYPYEHLKHIAVTCASSSFTLQSPLSATATSRQRKTCIMEGRQNKLAVKSFKAFEMIFKNLELELQANSSSNVKEVVLVMGSTPMSPNEVYRIQLPSLTTEDCDRPNNQRHSLLQLIRCLSMSSDLNDILGRPMAPTNTYIYLKMNKSGQTSDWFLPKDRYTLPSRGQQVIISITKRVSSCENDSNLGTPHIGCGFRVHQDNTDTADYEGALPKKVHLVGALEESKVATLKECLSSDINVYVGLPTTTQWYQSRLVLKGFKS